MLLGKIYKLVCNKTGLVYIGSTKQKLTRRLSKHVYTYKKGLTNSSRLVIEGGDYKIELIEEVEFENLLVRERYYIENTECVNMVIPSRTPKEWRENTKEKKKEYDKKYNKDNREKIAEQNKERGKKKVICPHCEKMYHRKYLKAHIKLMHQ